MFFLNGLMDDGRTLSIHLRLQALAGRTVFEHRRQVFFEKVDVTKAVLPLGIMRLNQLHHQERT